MWTGTFGQPAFFHVGGVGGGSSVCFLPLDPANESLQPAQRMHEEDAHSGEASKLQMKRENNGNKNT